MNDLLLIQTQTGWGQVLRSFADWCGPQVNWRTLDVGCGPGLLPALLAQRGCQAFGIDLDANIFSPRPLHAQVTQANGLHLPFTEGSFHLVTACNVLFMVEDPISVLKEMARVTRLDGQVLVLNPSGRMSVSAATRLADQRNLQGLARQSLIDWAARAEAHHRWGEYEICALMVGAGLQVAQMTSRVGPGLALLVRGIKVVPRRAVH
jgi:ubiquinone/menaquinone biosynthesis C-methylase UbiE